jgi:multidrug resistance efflux pump
MTEPMQDAAADTPGSTAGEKVPARRRGHAWIVFAVLLVGAAIYYSFGSFIAYTEDAYVRSDLVAIAPQVPGVIQSVAVRDNEKVSAGDLVAVIDPQGYLLDVKLKTQQIASLAALVAVKSQQRQQSPPQAGGLCQHRQGGRRDRGRDALAHHCQFQGGRGGVREARNAGARLARQRPVAAVARTGARRGPRHRARAIPGTASALRGADDRLDSAAAPLSRHHPARSAAAIARIVHGRGRARVLFPLSAEDE